MADFMTAVKTVHKASEKTEDPLLLPVSSQAVQHRQSTQKTTANTEDGERKGASSVTSPEETIQYLRSQPDLDGLVVSLRRLSTHHGLSGDFDIRTPGPLQAQIINTLVTTILPSFWPVFDKIDKPRLLACLRNTAGANALVARARFLCDTLSKSKSGDADTQELATILAVINDIFRPDDIASVIWTGLAQAVSNNVKRQLAWKDFVGLIASGKLTATVARSEDSLKASGSLPQLSSSLSSGAETSAWLGRNVATLMQQRVNHENDASDMYAAASLLLSKALGLGYAVSVIKTFFSAVILTSSDEESSVSGIDCLLQVLPNHTKRSLLETSLRWLSDSTDDGSQTNASHSEPYSQGITALINLLVKRDVSMQQHLIHFLCDPISSTFTTTVRRACVAVLAEAVPNELDTLLERLMTTFGEKVFIDHTPVITQEGIAQTMLLTAGYIHRNTPMALLMTARSSGHMQGVSSRLHSSNQRARWLGMVVGTSLSSLVDKQDSRLSFGTDEMLTEEAKWYQGLVKVDDKIGTIADSKKLLEKQQTAARIPRRPLTIEKSQKLPIIDGKQTFGPPKPPVPVQTEVIGDKVAEIEDDEEDEDEDLKPYAKPDSDPEDSDEDATLVNRNKARPPVYIRDLMRMLKEDQDHDKFQMAIKHAPGLIRRKTNFGGEVRDHAEELALMLCDLRDPFETEGFDELKLQAIIAVLLADVKTMAPWLSKQAFVGEYSLSQRCIMLSALGLGGRELAGYKADDLNPSLSSDSTSFPSKRLPDRLHAMYSPTDPSVKRLESASKSLEHQLIKPLALSAADKTTSHLDAVKVRTFSSRMDVERTKRKPAANQLALLLGEAFFFPLMTRYQQELAAYGSGSVFTSAPVVLVTFLKTLALLLHAAGPATLNLADITTAFWDLLLALRMKAISDISVLEAVLFSLLTLLEINGDAKQRIVQETPKQLMETQQWVELVFEKTGGGSLVTEGSGEEARVRTLAAGVLVKTKEIIETYQKSLVAYSSIRLFFDRSTLLSWTLGTQHIRNGISDGHAYHQDNRLDNVPEYEYEPLAENGSEIRVLSILPGNQADAIQIQLSTIVFDADSADKLPYEALSYTWGSPRDPAKVFITGENGLRSLAVTQNCHEALQNLRYSDNSRTVWIDAICINQRDLKERAQQVSIMRSVYGKAAGVIVWLGPSANDSDRAIGWIETIGKAFEWHHGAVVYRDPEMPLSVSDRLLQASYIVLEAFTDLLERPYFDRLWVWQEVQMGGDATTVRCGNSETTFQSLMTAVHFCGQNVHDDTPTIERFFARVDYIQNLPLNGTFDSLIALDRLRECQCADQRDRIYTAPAFGDVHSGPYMMPDYECSIQAVYVDFILRYLHENRGLGFLTHVGKSVLPTEATGQTGMPSWVPDWSQSKVAEPFIFGVCCGFSEASLVSVDRAQLTVQGVKVGTIHKSAMFGYHNLAIYTYLDICRTLQSLVPSNIDEVFLHRLVRVLTSSMYAEHCMSSMSVYATMDQCSRYLRQALEKHDVFSLDPSKIVLRDRELISTQRQFYVCRGRSLFTTMDDQVGLGPRDVREGDILVTVLSCESAMVLRSNEVDPNRYHVIGTAVCTHIMDAEPLLGQLPSEFESVVVQQESTGVYSPAFKNKLDGSITYEDPRLPPLSPEWETLSKDDSERYFAACPLAFRNKSTGDVRQYWRDPRMDADALEGRGVKIEDFKLV